MDGWEAAYRVEMEMIGKLVQHAVHAIVSAHVGEVDLDAFKGFRTLALESEE